MPLVGDEGAATANAAVAAAGEASDGSREIEVDNATVAAVVTVCLESVVIERHRHFLFQTSAMSTRRKRFAQWC